MISCCWWVLLLTVLAGQVWATDYFFLSTSFSPPILLPDGTRVVELIVDYTGETVESESLSSSSSSSAASDGGDTNLVPVVVCVELFQQHGIAGPWSSISKPWTCFEPDDVPQVEDYDLAEVEGFDRSQSHKLQFFSAYYLDESNSSSSSSSSFSELSGEHSSSKSTSEGNSNSSDVAGVLLAVTVKAWGPVGISRPWVGLSVTLLAFMIPPLTGVNKLLSLAAGCFVLLMFMVGAGNAPTLQEVASYVDVGPLLVIFGMTIVMNAFTLSGFFEFLAARCYQASGGRVALFSTLVSLSTCIVSTIFPNGTAILLMAPVGLKLSTTLSIMPVPMLMAQAFFANIGGAATAIGDPPNIIIASRLNLTFVDFLAHMTPGIAICAAVTMVVLVWYYRVIWRGQNLLDVHVLVNQFPIRKPTLLWRAWAIIFLMLITFVTGSWYNIYPAWVALFGSSALLLITEPFRIDKYLHAVDWEGLLYLAVLFAFAGLVENLSLMRVIGQGVSDSLERGVSEEFLLTVVMVSLLWITGIVSGFIESYAVAVFALPIIRIIATKLSLDVSVLAWALSFGCCLGDNSTVMAAPTNVIIAGLAKQVGHRITFFDFVRSGAVVTVVTLTTATVYLLVRHAPVAIGITVGTIYGVVLFVMLVLFAAWVWSRARPRRSAWLFPQRDSGSGAAGVPSSSSSSSSSSSESSSSSDNEERRKSSDSADNTGEYRHGSAPSHIVTTGDSRRKSSDSDRPSHKHGSGRKHRHGHRHRSDDSGGDVEMTEYQGAGHHKKSREKRHRHH
ncbi:arsenical PUMP membrane protein [Pelomyxa schiedti]|nr:arsenical PUMP membrane protein [Pelomyxa schiedti]